MRMTPSGRCGPGWNWSRQWETLRPHAALQTRVGIATGLVVVGDLIGSGEAQERGIVGETPNLAARLQGTAEPNTVVIAESTRKLFGNLFELQDLGAKEVKGIAEPVRAWAALRASSMASRFEALHATGLTALVGRDEELELLLRRWSKAKTGQAATGCRGDPVGAVHIAPSVTGFQTRKGSSGTGSKRSLQTFQSPNWARNAAILFCHAAVANTALLTTKCGSRPC